MIMANETDRLLIEQIRDESPQAWEQLIARYEGRLRAFLLRRIKNRDVCDDLAQETFIGFLTSLPHYDDSRELQTYLFTIASYKLTDYLRKTGRHPMQQVTSDASGGDPLQQRADPRPAASSVARGNERRELEEQTLIQCVGTILKNWMKAGDFQRVKVLELLFVKGWANKDAAKHLGLTEQQIANFRFAAIRKITDAVGLAGLNADVFPELRDSEGGGA